ncbi:MAG: Hpt domain-containing protein, partial [Solirubrobacterales bacterium]|nr:Hpt domain-containing protein [Solirubrobacterales bacterium]
QAHRIKGAARIVGAREIERLAEQIESSVETQDGERAVQWEVLEDRAARLACDLEHLVAQR